MSRHQGTIYRWEIFSGDERIGVYIGKTDQKSQSAACAGIAGGWTAYSAESRTQTPSPMDTERCIGRWRPHYIMGIESFLTALSAAQPGLSLDELESRFIREHDSYGPAPHQLNEKP